MQNRNSAIINDTSMEDIDAACRMIQSARKSGRVRSKRIYRKSITQKLSVEHGRRLSCQTVITYDPKTGLVYSSGCLLYCSHSIYPTKNQKRRCISEHTLDLLYKNRKQRKEYHARFRYAKRITQKIGVGDDGHPVSTSTIIQYNKKTDTIIYTHQLYYHGYIGVEI